MLQSVNGVLATPHVPIRWGELRTIDSLDSNAFNARSVLYFSTWRETCQRIVFLII